MSSLKRPHIAIHPDMIARHRKKIGIDKFEDDLVIERLMRAAKGFREASVLMHDYALKIEADKGPTGQMARQSYGKDATAKHAKAAMDGAMEYAFSQIAYADDATRPPELKNKALAAEIRRHLATMDAEQRNKLLESDEAALSAAADAEAPPYLSGTTREQINGHLAVYANKNHPTVTDLNKRRMAALNDCRMMHQRFDEYVTELVRAMGPKPMEIERAKATKAAQDAIREAAAQ
jgi:hypothetical protein